MRTLFVLLSLLLLGGIGLSAGSVTSLPPLPTLLAQTSPDPLTDQEAVADRIETGSPGQTVLHEGNRRGVYAIAAIVALGLLTGAIWFMRSNTPKRRLPE